VEELQNGQWEWEYRRCDPRFAHPGSRGSLIGIPAPKAVPPPVPARTPWPDRTLGMAGRGLEDLPERVLAAVRLPGPRRRGHATTGFAGGRPQGTRRERAVGETFRSPINHPFPEVPGRAGVQNAPRRPEGAGGAEGLGSPAAANWERCLSTKRDAQHI